MGAVVRKRRPTRRGRRRRPRRWTPAGPRDMAANGRRKLRADVDALGRPRRGGTPLRASRSPTPSGRRRRSASDRRPSCQSAAAAPSSAAWIGRRRRARRVGEAALPLARSQRPHRRTLLDASSWPRRPFGRARAASPLARTAPLRACRAAADLAAPPTELRRSRRRAVASARARGGGVARATWSAIASRAASGGACSTVGRRKEGGATICRSTRRSK